jgi:hypothetical protein
MLQPPGVCAELEWKRPGFESEGIIRKIIPNDTPVWITWREKVLDIMRNREVRAAEASCCDLLQMNDDLMFEQNDQNEHPLENPQTE